MEGWPARGMMGSTGGGRLSRMVLYHCAWISVSSTVYFSPAVLMPRSEGFSGRWTSTIRSTGATGCCSKAKGRYIRDERTQVRSTAILPTHHVRFVSGVPPHRRGISMRGLSVCLSQEMLPQSRHQMYLEIQCGCRESLSELGEQC